MARDPTLLAADALAAFLKAHPGWQQKGATLVRTFEFQKFAEGIRFVDRVAEAADALDHHPDIDIRYTRITFTLSTHAPKGLTFRDTALAERMDSVFTG